MTARIGRWTYRRTHTRPVNLHYRYQGFRLRVRYATTSSNSPSLISVLRVIGIPYNPCRTTVLMNAGVRSVRCSSTAGTLPWYFKPSAKVPGSAPVANIPVLGASAPWQGAHHLLKTAFPFFSAGAVWAEAGSVI